MKKKLEHDYLRRSFLFSKKLYTDFQDIAADQGITASELLRHIMSRECREYRDYLNKRRVINE